MSSEHQDVRWLSHDDILSLEITVEEQREALESYYCDASPDLVKLPKKVIIRRDQEFYTSMPIVLRRDTDVDVYQSKLVWRTTNGCPAIQSTISVVREGNLEAVLDGSFITAMRTGGLAAITAVKLAVPEFSRVVVIGLGNCMTAAMTMLCEIVGPDRKLDILVIEYHNAAEFISVFGAKYPNLSFTLHPTIDSCGDVDIVFSGVTFSSEPLMTRLPPGCVLVPMHVRGFRFADTEASHVVADDIHGIDHFKMFPQFESKLYTTQDVFLGKAKRSSPEETFLVYQYGTALSDAALTDLILRKARAAGVGTLLPHSGPSTKNWALRAAQSQN